MNDINANRKPTRPTPKFWHRFTAISGLPSGVPASPMTQIDSTQLKLELPRNNLEIFVIGHVVASLHGCQDSGGDFQLELQSRLRLVKPRILFMPK